MANLHSIVSVLVLSVAALKADAAVSKGAAGISLDLFRTYRSYGEDPDWTSLGRAANAQAADAGTPNANSIYQYFTVTQDVIALGFDKPPRQAECKDVTAVNNQLMQHVRSSHKALVQAATGLSAITTLLQRQTHCSYTTAFTYVGDVQLKKELVNAASNSTLCDALSWYCQATFPVDGHYHLQATSAAVDTPLPPVVSYNCRQQLYKQQLDHFNSADARTWEQLYYVCDKSWPVLPAQQEATGTVLVFLGNESPLDTPQQPIIFENADKHNALVILVEHRYYGKSIPVHTNAEGQMLTSDFKWLTIEQVIEDSTAILHHVRAQLRVPSSVPNVVVGGSYGGQIAAYHRLSKPDVFGAAIAASAPVTYVPGTSMWLATSNRYYMQVAKSAAVMGGPSCFLAIREAVSAADEEIKTLEGRERIGRLFAVCKATPVESYRAGREFVLTTIGAFEGMAQVNNQPSLLGEMEEACAVVQESIASGASALQALAELFKYQQTSGQPGWCYEFRYSPDRPGHIPQPPTKASIYDAYSYQCCTQGTVYGGLIPAHTSAGTFYPRYHVSLAEHVRSCREAFGSDLPPYQVPAFLADVVQLVLSVGGIVFTNGELDTWAGGSWTSWADVQAVAAATADTSATEPNSKGVYTYETNNGQQQLQSADNGKEPYSRLAFVVYRNASHCTDTHTHTWNQPGEPAEWKQQRAQAMDYAVQMARANYTQR